MRVVLDTNVVISAMAFGGRLRGLRDSWTDGEILPVLSQETYAELVRVLAYPKFRQPAATQAGMLEAYLRHAEMRPPPSALFNIPDFGDPTDIPFIRLALHAGVPLVTGDRKVAALRGRLPLELLSAGELQARLGA